MSTPKTNLPRETSESKKKALELSQIPEEPKKKKKVIFQVLKIIPVKMNIEKKMV